MMAAKKKTRHWKPDYAKPLTEGKTKSLTKTSTSTARPISPPPAPQPKEPKAGDTVSLAFHYVGLISWESVTIDKVAKGKEVLWIDGQLYEQKEDGTYVYEDYTLGPCKKIIHLDGGSRAGDYLSQYEDK